jgi:hypothetical protein
MYIIQGKLNGSIIKYECDTATEVRSKLKFIRIDKEKYKKKWTNVQVIAKDQDVTKLFL